MSLKDSWQQQRQQRQHEAAQRQQTVAEALTVTRQERQIKAAQLRDELSLFRAALADESTTYRAELQQFCQKLHLDTQAFLTAASDRRHIQATQLNQTLDAFIQRLRQQTAAFLATAQAERTVAAYRLEQELIAFVDALRSDVKSYLIELESVRHQRAAKLDQALMHSRAKREAETQALFQRLAVFRAELQRFSQDLHSTVWGDHDVVRTDAPVAKPPLSKTVTKPIGRGFGQPNGSVPVTKTVGAFQNGNSVAVVPPIKAAKTPQVETIAHEKEVYAHIHTVQGARLTEIEAALGLNRFQAVDALRSLIKKGLITQRDRIYLAQTQLAHT
ncbi:MAG: gas vesicle protein GvpC [Leptolyngbya sp. BL-A-14]